MYDLRSVIVMPLRHILSLQNLATMLTGLVMLFLLIAAASKLLDLPEFQRSLDTWSFVPPRVRPVAALFVPALELIVSLGWFLSARRQRFALAATIMLTVFTIAYLLHWLWIEKPTCNCLGIITRYLGDRESTAFFLIRNAALLAILVFSLVLDIRRSAPSDGPTLPDATVTPRAKSATGRPAFTLIELICVIFIIGLLIALLAPQLRGVRKSAERTTAFARLAEHGRAFAAYTVDFRDTWPYLTDPNATYTVFRAPDIDIGVQYWMVYSWWHVPMSELVYKVSWKDAVFRNSRRDPPGQTPFWYSCAFLADPGFFTKGRTGRDQWRATRVDEVLFPSRKALVINSSGWESENFATQDLPMVFADGSAEQLPRSLTTSWDYNGTGAWNPGGLFMVPIPGMTTAEGVRGRDKQ